MKNLNNKHIIIAICIIIGVAIFFLTKEKPKTLNITNTVIQNVSSENVTASSISEIIVHITGAVKNEGIVFLKEGNRISDAITAAGGVTDIADLSKINLAYTLSDGQKIYIPSIYDDEVENYVSKDAGSSVLEEDNLSILVNINTATQTELETLSGIGPSTALKIINYRKENGKFEKIEDIMNVSGIGDSKFEVIKDYICVK